MPSVLTHRVATNCESSLGGRDWRTLAAGQNAVLRKLTEVIGWRCSEGGCADVIILFACAAIRSPV
jgi:hypothetical protein